MRNAQLVVQIYNAKLKFFLQKTARTLDKNYMTLKRIFAPDRQKILLKNLSSVSIDFFQFIIAHSALCIHNCAMRIVISIPR